MLLIVDVRSILASMSREEGDSWEKSLGDVTVHAQLRSRGEGRAWIRDESHSFEKVKH